MDVIIDWVVANYGLVLGVLLGISEALALIPGIKSNSIFTLIYNFLLKFKPAPKV